MPTALTRPASHAEVQEAVRSVPLGARPPAALPRDEAAAVHTARTACSRWTSPASPASSSTSQVSSPSPRWPGTPIAEIAAALAEHGQFLPFDPPLVEAGATLGGTVAAGREWAGTVPLRRRA